MIDALMKNVIYYYSVKEFIITAIKKKEVFDKKI